jgi:hypothetical protein
LVSVEDADKVFLRLLEVTLQEAGAVGALTLLK